MKNIHPNDDNNKFFIVGYINAQTNTLLLTLWRGQ